VQRLRRWVRFGFLIALTVALIGTIKPFKMERDKHEKELIYDDLSKVKNVSLEQHTTTIITLTHLTTEGQNRQGNPHSTEHNLK
jgi:hypothetical protein